MSGGATQESLDLAIAGAVADGMTVVAAGPHELLLDLDDEAALGRYENLRPALAENFGGAESERWRSKSGQGWHVVVRLLKPMDVARRIALQASLGSDGLRELLAIACLENNVTEPSVLFRPAEGGGR